jgi:hypothetical protein
MAAEYQEPDWKVVDYQCYCLDERVHDPSWYRPLRVRGPRPERIEPGGYFICLGAAQTFGRFCARPFPNLLEERLGLPCLNISHGGAGPLFFCLENEALLGYLNSARFVIVQVMSARSESNSLFESRGVGHYRRRSDGQDFGCDQAFADLLRSRPRSFVESIVEETRQSWLSSYQTLLSAIHVPKILLWYSTRRPEYRQSWNSVTGLFGAFPQLVNAAMVARLREMGDGYVECTSKRGLPQPLIDRFTGKRTTVTDPWTSAPWKENWYYPSPEMHEDAADALEPICRLLAQSGRARLSEARCGTSS